MKTTTVKTFMRSKSIVRYAFALSALLVLQACGPKGSASTSAEKPAPTAIQELSGQMGLAVLWYQRSNERKLLCIQAYKRAEELLVKNFDRYGGSAAMPTVILDIDETVLDNSPYEARVFAEGKTYDAESWSEWVNAASAEPIPGVLGFLQLCEGLGVEVFFISNRDAEAVEPTIQNLLKYEIPYASPDRMLFKEDMSDKTERREILKQGRTIILSVGDQLSDFASPEFTQRYEINARETKSSLPDTLMQHFVLLPNPMYGSFEKELYQGKKLSNEEKLRARKRALILD